MSFPRYSEYKDSGVEWLKEIPVHWKLASPKRYLQPVPSTGLIKGTCSSAFQEGLFPGYSASGQDIWLPTFQYSGDGLVLSAVGARCGKTFLASGKWGAVANTQCLLPSVAADTRFFWYLTNIQDWWERGGAAQPYVLVSETLSRPWAFPEKNEQALIASFLDHETARIDALVAEQQRLIELLKEKRQAVISHAVTKGLNPDAPMKDSGVEWLGEVAAHWGVVPLGLLAEQIQTGPFGSQLHSHEYVEDGVPVINPSNIIDGRIVPDMSSTVTPEVAERLSHQQLREGEIVVGRRGEMGRCAVVTSSDAGWLCGTGSMKIVLSNRIDPMFACLFIRTPLIRGLLQIESVGSTMDNLNPEILSRIRIPLPPIQEQRFLIEKVTLADDETQALIGEAIQGSKLLQERRSALISAAVTGKIDVRGWQPPPGSSAPTETTAKEPA